MPVQNRIFCKLQAINGSTSKWPIYFIIFEMAYFGVCDLNRWKSAKWPISVWLARNGLFCDFFNDFWSQYNHKTQNGPFQKRWNGVIRGQTRTMVFFDEIFRIFGSFWKFLNIFNFNFWQVEFKFYFKFRFSLFKSRAIIQETIRLRSLRSLEMLFLWVFSSPKTLTL